MNWLEKVKNFIVIRAVAIYGGCHIKKYFSQSKKAALPAGKHPADRAVLIFNGRRGFLPPHGRPRFWAARYPGGAAPFPAGAAAARKGPCTQCP